MDKFQILFVVIGIALLMVGAIAKASAQNSTSPTNTTNPTPTNLTVNSPHNATTQGQLQAKLRGLY